MIDRFDADSLLFLLCKFSVTKFSCLSLVHAFNTTREQEVILILCYVTFSHGQGTVGPLAISVARQHIASIAQPQLP